MIAIPPMLTKILGLDPGGTNGLVLAIYSPRAPLEVISAWEITDRRQLYGRISYELAHFGPLDRIIAEDWQNQQHAYKVDARLACMPLGALEHIAWNYKLNVQYRQPGPPATINSELLRSSNYWITGGGGHARAILKHMLQQLIDEHHRPTLDKLYSKGEFSGQSASRSRSIALRRS